MTLGFIPWTTVLVLIAWAAVATQLGALAAGRYRPVARRSARAGSAARPLGARAAGSRSASRRRARSVAARDVHDRVGGRRPHDHVRLLARRCGSRSGPASAHEIRRAHEVVPLGPWRDLAGEVAGPKRRRRVGMALEREQRGRDEEQRADERRDAGSRAGRRRASPRGRRRQAACPDASRRPRRPPRRRGAPRPGGRGRAGPTETPPEVTTTSASSARARACSSASSLSSAAREPLDDGARRREGGREHDPVRLVDLAGLEGVAGLAQLGAGDDDRRRVARGAPCIARIPQAASAARRAAVRTFPAARIVAGADVAAATAGCCLRRRRRLGISISSGRDARPARPGSPRRRPRERRRRSRSRSPRRSPRARCDGRPAATLPTTGSTPGVSPARTA